MCHPQKFSAAFNELLFYCPGSVLNMHFINIKNFVMAASKYDRQVSNAIQRVETVYHRRSIPENSMFARNRDETATTVFAYMAERGMHVSGKSDTVF